MSPSQKPTAWPCESSLYLLTPEVELRGVDDLDYNCIIQPGAILALALVGIYADVVKNKNVIVYTNYVNGQLNRPQGSRLPSEEARSFQTQATAIHVTSTDVKCGS